MPTKRKEPVEAISSYAHRVGDRIHLVLHLHRTTTGRDTARLRFISPERRFAKEVAVTPAEPGILIDTTVAARRLGRAVWSMELQLEDDGPFTVVEARLLTGRRQPIALLPGPTPDTRMPAPQPRPAPVTVRNRLGSLKRKTTHLAGDVVAPAVRSRLGR